MALGKGIFLLFCVSSLLSKVSSVEKSKRDQATYDDGKEKSENETSVAEKRNLESINSTLFPAKMKLNRNAKVNLRICRLKVKWFEHYPIHKRISRKSGRPLC